MRRLLVLGSSHTAAVKLGWEQLAQCKSDWDIVFHALPGKTFRKLQIDESRRFGALTPSGFAPEMLADIRAALGNDHIDLTTADAVVSIGWYLHEIEVVRLATAYSIDGVHPAEGQPRLSRGAWSAALDALALHTLPQDPWLGWKAPALFLLPKPRPAESCLSDRSEAYEPWRRLAAIVPYGAVLLEEYLGRARSVLADAGVHLIPLPSSVLAPSGLTFSRFARQAPKLATDDYYPETDHHHMNADYGEIVVRHMLDAIATTLEQKE